MGGWKMKLIFLLIVYFAGFATATYYLAPVPDSQDFYACENSQLNSSEFIQSFNAGLHKCVDFTRDAFWRVSRFVKQKLDERKTDT